jgi:hypothetical protein
MGGRWVFERCRELKHFTHDERLADVTGGHADRAGRESAAPWPQAGADRGALMSDDLPTPRTMSRTGLRVHVWCKACRHAKAADLAALITAGRGDVPLVRIRWRCGNCRSRLTDFVVTGSHLRPQS